MSVFTVSSAFALKGMDYDQVNVNLVKDGGQQVMCQLVCPEFLYCNTTKCTRPMHTSMLIACYFIVLSGNRSIQKIKPHATSACCDH